MMKTSCPTHRTTGNKAVSVFSLVGSLPWSAMIFVISTIEDCGERIMKSL
jgi:hypothetical protein